MTATVILSLLTGLAATPQTTVVRPEDTGAALVNPSMGWTMHYYSNIPTNYGWKLAPSDTLDDFPGLSVVYLRIPWSYLEPEEGRFNWNVLDTPAQRWVALGKQVAFRITCSESWMEWATPEWVHAAGAKGVRFTPGKARKDGPYWEPDYGDPVFLEKLEDFLKAFGRRYDGNPNVAFVDVGTYGVWGEGHTHASTGIDYPLDIKKHHIDLHVKYFPNTQLAISDDFAGHDAPGEHFPITDYALSKGITLRDDSICVQPPPRSWYHDGMARLFAPHFPVVIEHEHYGGSKARGAWGDGSLLLKSVEDYRASYMSIHWWPRVELEENRELIDRINRRMGYRLQPREVAWPDTIAMGASFTIASTWANAGVAPCYPGGFVAYTLKDAEGGIVAVLVDESFDLRDLENGPPDAIPTRALESSFTIAEEVIGAVGTTRSAPNTAPGGYSLFVSVGQRDGTPTIALPIKDDDGQHRYRLGDITLTGYAGDYDLEHSAVRMEGREVTVPLCYTIHAALPGVTQPYGHAEVDGQIAAQGTVDGVDVEALRKPGEASGTLRFTLPKDLAGKTILLKTGLWAPGHKELPLERIRPNNDPGDRSLVVGTLRVDENGKARLVE